ncbi:MAG: SRPBCC family protein [Verrucomicrobia bacterium]|nr:SRPBCC family protein [Verrucomicrobiota bacterium]
MPVTYQSTVVKASLGDVWDRISNFHDLSWAPEVITKCEKIGDAGGGEVGAKRVLNDAFHETVTRVDAGEHVIEYSIDDGPSPVSANDVSNYLGVIKLKPVTMGDGDSTFVEWSSSWDSDSDDAVDFCHGIYVALLNGLRASF